MINICDDKIEDITMSEKKKKANDLTILVLLTIGILG